MKSLIAAKTNRWLTMLLCVVVFMSLASLIRAGQSGVGGKRDITIMTQNLYVGSSFAPIASLNPADTNYVAELLQGVATVYGQILASDFPSRADVLAQEIASKQPDLVALQEVALIRRQSPGDAISGGTTPATTVVRDYLKILLRALRQHGAAYRVANRVQNLDVELPIATADTNVFDDVRLTDRDVILARSDLPPGYLRLSNKKHGNFTAALPLPSGIDVLRGWCSVDAFVRGRRFQVINAHLEERLPASLPDIQAAQASELLAGPAHAIKPVILVGDFNSDANGTDGSTVYPLLMTQGKFTDTWSVMHPGDLGLTWGHDEFLADLAVVFSQRLDLILYRGGKFGPQNAEVLDPVISAVSPMWISDHGGVISTLSIK